MRKTKKKVKCMKAASRWYVVGGVYDVYVDDGKEFILGADGFYDQLDICLSKFEPYETTE